MTKLHVMQLLIIVLTINWLQLIITLMIKEVLDYERILGTNKTQIFLAFEKIAHFDSIERLAF